MFAAVALVAGMMISNVPESLASSRGMAEQGDFSLDLYNSMQVTAPTFGEHDVLYSSYF